jgi:hypothetical protein
MNKSNIRFCDECKIICHGFTRIKNIFPRNTRNNQKKVNISHGDTENTEQRISRENNLLFIVQVINNFKRGRKRNMKKFSYFFVRFS